MSRTACVLAVVLAFTVLTVPAPATAAGGTFTLAPESVVGDRVYGLRVNIYGIGDGPQEPAYPSIQVSTDTDATFELAGGYLNDVVWPDVLTPGHCMEVSPSMVTCGMLGTGALDISGATAIDVSCYNWHSDTLCGRSPHVTGTPGNDSLSVWADTLAEAPSVYAGWMGDVVISAGDGDDSVYASPNTSGSISAGAGDDTIRTYIDQSPPSTGTQRGHWEVSCGSQDDTVVLAPHDTAGADCEHGLRDECSSSAKAAVTTTWKPGDRTATYSAAGSKVKTGTKLKTTYNWKFGDGTTATRVTAAAFKHTYKTPGEYTATLTVKQGTCSSKKSTWVVVNPVAAYAPTVRLRPGEHYFPGDPNAFIKTSKLEYWPQTHRFGDGIDTGCEPTVLAGKKGSKASLHAKKAKDRPIVAKRLSGQDGQKPYKAKRRTWDHSNRFCAPSKKKLVSNGSVAATSKDGPGLGSFDNDDGIILNPGDKPSYRDGNPPSKSNYVTAPMYFESNIDRKGAGYVVYWFFYPYNDWKREWKGPDYFERHEGDWEHIVVRVGPQAKLSNVAYYQHTCKKPKTIARSDLERDSESGYGVHPMVWSALGGHASYPTNIGTNKKGVCGSDGKGTSGIQGKGDRTGKGAIWRPWGVGLVRDATAQPWYGFTGNWGDRVKAAYSAYGPVGPGPERSIRADTVPKSWR